MEGLSKKEKGLMDMDNSVVIAQGGGVRGLNGNGKKYNKGYIPYFSDYKTHQSVRCT